METRMFLCFHVTCKHKNMHVSMYFLHLELTFTPHYIITDKGLLKFGRIERKYFPGENNPLYGNWYEIYRSISLLSSIESLADDDTGLIHGVDIVLQSKVGSHPMCQHPVVGVPGWELERLHSGRWGGGG